MWAVPTRSTGRVLAGRYRIGQADLRDVREADGFRWCTDSEVYPLNLMLFTGLDYPRDGTAADPLAD